MRQFPPRAADAPDLGLRRQQTETLLSLALIHAVFEREVAGLFAAHDLDGITPAQSNVLMALFQARGPLTARAVTRRLGLSEATISRFVKALEAAGWVARQRDPDDARAMLIEATDKARAALPRFIAVSNTLLDRAFAGFSRDEIEWLGAAVARVTDNFAPEE